MQLKTQMQIQKQDKTVEETTKSAPPICFMAGTIGFELLILLRGFMRWKVGRVP